MDNVLMSMVGMLFMIEDSKVVSIFVLRVVF